MWDELILLVGTKAAKATKKGLADAPRRPLPDNAECSVRATVICYRSPLVKIGDEHLVLSTDGHTTPNLIRYLADRRHSTAKLSYVALIPKGDRAKTTLRADKHRATQIILRQAVLELRTSTDVTGHKGARPDNRSATRRLNVSFSSRGNDTCKK
jgi:hypothetical protein